MLSILEGRIVLMLTLRRISASVAAIIKTAYIENYGSNTDNLWNATELTIWTT